MRNQRGLSGHSFYGFLCFHRHNLSIEAQGDGERIHSQPSALRRDQKSDQNIKRRFTCDSMQRQSGLYLLVSSIQPWLLTPHIKVHTDRSTVYCPQLAPCKASWAVLCMHVTCCDGKNAHYDTQDTLKHIPAANRESIVAEATQGSAKIRLNLQICTSSI